MIMMMISSKIQETLKMHALISCLVVLIITTSSRTHASYLTYNSAIQMSAEQHQIQQQQLQQQQPPSIIPFSFNSNVQENQRAIVMCTTSSGENPVSFTWLKDGQLLSAGQAQARRITIKPDTDSSTLKISSVRLDHAGNYTCLAKNRFGSQTHSAQLVVHGEPRWLKEPHHEPLVTTQGQTVVIDCQTTGWPKPEQTWKYKTHLHGEFHSVTYASGHFQLAANGSLIIRQAEKSDEANYLCISSNGIGRGLSWSTSLKVTVPAHFETSGRAQTTVIRKQSQVQLRCDAFGDQPITIEWLKNNKSLAAPAAAAALYHNNNMGNVDSNLLVDPRYSIHSNSNAPKNGLISQLLIRQAQRSDNAIYECVARNLYGRDRQVIELIVQEEPDYIQELQVTAVNSRSVTLMWSEPYDGRSPITSYMFQYKRVQDAYVPTLTSAIPTMSGDLETFGGLDGDQAAAQQVSGSTSQQHLLGRLAQVSPLEGDWQHANRIAMPVLASAGNHSAGTERSITIEKLDPSSKYILRALALNSIGQSKFSPPMEFSTDEEAPEVGPVNIRAVAINSTSIAVSWDEIPRSKHLGRIHGYYVGYRPKMSNTAATRFLYKPYIINDLVASSSSPLALESSGGDQNSVINQQQQQQQVAASSQSRLEMVIQELRRDTAYEITVVAFNSRGSSPTSDFVECKTIEMDAPKPVKLSIRREANESIFVEWQRDPTDQNPVDYYMVYQEKNSASQEWLQIRLTGNETHYTAPGLKCGTRYQFYITGHNKIGKSQPSEVLSASTSGAIPVVPSKQSLIKWVNSTCLLVNLNSFQDNGCRIKTFTVRYRVERQQASAASSAVESGASAAQSSGGLGASTTSGNGQHKQQQAAAAAAGAQAASSQLIGSNGMSASHQALTVAGQLGGKAVLAGQTSNSAVPYPSEWIAIRPKSNLKQQRANEEDRMEYLCDLSPVGEYTIHVAAANDVGRSEIEYTVLMSSDELRHSALKDFMEFMGGLSTVFAYIPSLLVFLLAALLLVIVCLILYTTAIKYYQKFVIMQNQMRATRRAKADEKRRRKLNNLTHGARNPTAAAGGRDKSVELWADEFEDGAGDDDDDEQLDQDDIEIIGSGGGGAGGGAISRHNCSSSQDSILDVDGDDEDETTATEELASSSSSSGGGINGQRVRGRRAAKRHASTVSHSHRHNHLQQQQQQQRHVQHQYHQKQHSNPLMQAQMAKHHQDHQGHYHTHAQQQQQQQPLYGTLARHQYLSNIADSAFGGDTSSIDTSLCNATGKGKFNGNGSICMSTASNDSIHGRFQCLNSKQYVKMNEYTMLPSISASLAQQQPSDVYGTMAAPMSHAHHQVYRPLTGSSPSGQSSASNTTTTANASQSGQVAPTATNYSTLRRTNMQTYLPRNQQASAAQRQLARRPSQNVNDIYGYYMAPPAQAQVQAAQAAAAAQQAANEAANSIFVPPQQIIYSAPNIRRQPAVFL